MLTPASFLLYSNEKVALKGKRFNNISYIQIGEPNLLKSISLLVFQATCIDLHKES
jgi:hypothetical protein